LTLSFLRRFFPILEGSAPSFLGAVFCACIFSGVVSCEKKGTPDWGPSQESRETKTVTPPSDSNRSHAGSDRKPDGKVDRNSPAQAIPVGKGLRFITYNVENWLTMDRLVDRKALKNAPKPESEKAAVVRLLARQAPDVLGLCEIGEASDLAELQQRLKAGGLDLPNLHFTGGSDPTRHLGILSRFPITSTAKPVDTEYKLDGQTFAINRGILDATIEAGSKSYRFVGVHLKSKRDSEQGDQEAIRLHEARLLRRHVDSILRKNAGARLIVYGDFNDTRATPALKTITGKYNAPDYLTCIPAKDSHHEAWTYYWELHDIYSRIDFIMVSPGIKKDVIFQQAKIVDDSEWQQASDHRPLLAVFR
jgi:endonuclease/exonuclease/phosphatase family metal-dependent hydrolase